jgi:UMF1 family MFS transporter
VARALVAASVTQATAKLASRQRAWLLTEAANEPFFALIQRFIFSAYFANQLASDAVAGAQMWSLGLGLAGILTAVLAPMAGAAADATGQRRAFVRTLTLLCALACASLWFARPGMPLLLPLCAVVIAAVGMELIIALTNAELSSLGDERELGFLSGLNFAVGQGAAVVALAAVAYLSSLRSVEDAFWVERSVGPIAGAALVLLLLPYLLSRSDVPVRQMSTDALRESRRLLLGALRDALLNRNMRLLIIGRAIGADGLSIVFAFGAILAGSIFQWRGAELAMFGIVVTTFGALGGLLAGWFDRRFGSKATVQLAFALCGVGTAGIVGSGADRVLFVPWSDADVLFGLSAPQLAYVASACIAALSGGPCFGGMRTLVAKIAPTERMGVFFGLFSLVGKATYFLGPVAFSLMLSLVEDRRLALGIVYVFLLVGVACFWSLRVERMSDVRTQSP